MSRPAQAIINLQALRHNYRIAKQLANGESVLAVVKADAYSHGATVCAEALADVADGFAVSCIEEAMALREAGIAQTILLMEGIFEAAELLLVEQHQLDIVVHNTEQLEILKCASWMQPLRAWLKMDSGMGRVGFLPEQYQTAWQQLKALPWVQEIVMMTHFACADEVDDQHLQQQLQTFEHYTAGLEGERSLCNSAALMRLPQARAEWNRPGLLLYGISPLMFETPEGINLQPVMTLQSAIMSIKNVPAGSAVGYGARWIAQRDTKVGIVAMGYADGYPRHAPSGTPVFINGCRAPLIGTVSMDMLAVDLTDIPAVGMGDTVELWGRHIAIEEIARQADAIPYQLLCNVKRVLIRYEDTVVKEDAFIQPEPKRQQANDECFENEAALLLSEND